MVRRRKGSYFVDRPDEGINWTAKQQEAAPQAKVSDLLTATSSLTPITFTHLPWETRTPQPVYAGGLFSNVGAIEGTTISVSSVLGAQALCSTSLSTGTI